MFSRDDDRARKRARKEHDKEMNKLYHATKQVLAYLLIRRNSGKPAVSVGDVATWCRIEREDAASALRELLDIGLVRRYREHGLSLYRACTQKEIEEDEET